MRVDDADPYSNKGKQNVLFAFQTLFNPPWPSIDVYWQKCIRDNRDMAIRAIKAIGCDHRGVDFLTDDIKQIPIKK